MRGETRLLMMLLRSEYWRLYCGDYRLEVDILDLDCLRKSALDL